jgi:hypothetical protein
MLILSPYKDYYDQVLGQGIDKTLVYNRTQTETVVTKSHDIKHPPEIYEMVQLFEKNIGRTHGWNTNNFSAMPFVIGFCGKMYLGYKLQHYICKFVYEYAYDTETIVSFLEQYDKQELEKFLAPSEKSKLLNKWFQNLRKDQMEKYFHFFDDNQYLHSLFVNHKCPSFVFDLGKSEMKFITNPELSKYDFKKVMNPYQAFQEISMYLGGVLGCGNPDMVKISDLELAKKHGMDKTSFRTPSPGKKFKRRS